MCIYIHMYICALAGISPNSRYNECRAPSGAPVAAKPIHALAHEPVAGALGGFLHFEFAKFTVQRQTRNPKPLGLGLELEFWA